jgi:rhodanese-related sulfurtransferase
MKKILLMTLAVSTILYAGPTLTPEVKALISEAKSKVETVSVAQADALIKKGSVILLDIRDPDEWENGVIKADKLVKISRGFLEVKYPKLILNNYKKEDAYIVYCAIEPRSILAASRLKELGFTNVTYLKGGYKNWTAQKYPTTK